MEALQALLEDAFASHADKPALLQPDGAAITFGELERRCAALCAQLSAAGARARASVVFDTTNTDRAREVVSRLACLRLGAVWVPVDGGAAAADDDARPACRCRVVDGTFAVDAVADAATWPADALYLLRTSGTTGGAKFVAGSAKATLHRLKWQWDRFPWRDDDAMLLRTPATFVDSVAEVLGAALAGAPGACCGGDLGDLVQAAAATKATRAVVTPSILAVVLRSLDAAGERLETRLPALRFWTVSGEATRATLVDDFARHAPGATLVNVWGSTETAADACFHVLLGPGAAPRGRGDPAVGFPLTRAVRVSLDGGEVLVAGAAVALGYARGGAIVASPRFAGGAVRTCVEINHWFGGSPPNFRTLYLSQIEVDSADLWTNRLLSSSSRSTTEELAPKLSHTLTLKSG